MAGGWSCDRLRGRVSRIARCVPALRTSRTHQDAEKDFAALSGVARGTLLRPDSARASKELASFSKAATDQPASRNHRICNGAPASATCTTTLSACVTTAPFTGRCRAGMTVPPKPSLFCPRPLVRHAALAPLPPRARRRALEQRAPHWRPTCGTTPAACASPARPTAVNASRAHAQHATLTRSPRSGCSSRGQARYAHSLV